MKLRFPVPAAAAALLCTLLSMPVLAQQRQLPPKEFTDVTVLSHTPVRDQASTSTCWCFSAISFLESELQRMGKPAYDLSEMWIVHHVYHDKAETYVRMHGNNNFGPGGLGHDVFAAIAEHGIVREQDYPGTWPYEEQHNHAEMHAVLTGMLDAVIQARPGPSPKWMKGYAAALAAYLGPLPESITVDGRSLSPKQFADQVLEIEPDKYVELTSFSHMPWYETVDLLVPDNWVRNDDTWNLPADDAMEILRHAIESGYTVVFGGDVSERTFDQRIGYAVWREGEEVTDADRQATWDAWSTTDDHGMHVVGIATDEAGNVFYRVKNSWGETGPYGGHIYMSENYIRAKFDLLTVHIDAVPDNIRARMGR